MGTGHGFWLSGRVLWCNICEAFAEGCGTMALARHCTGKRVKGDRQGGRNGLLHNFETCDAACTLKQVSCCHLRYLLTPL